MQLETFRGYELHNVVKQVRGTLGEDAMIVRSRTIRRPAGDLVEVIAARPEAIESFRRRLDGGRAAAVRARGRRRIGPYVIALVGPAGSGKTTTAVKLALHPRGVGHKRVALVTLDTYRVGALEELQTYAEIANLPLEVVYRGREVPEVVKRLRDVDVVVVDTPGRWTEGDPDATWMDALHRLDPDEVHLVLPAGLRFEVALACRDRFKGSATHVLFSKLDEVPGDQDLASMAEAVALPARWIAEGHDIPGDLAEAAPRILASLGIGGSRPDHVRRVG